MEDDLDGSPAQATIRFAIGTAEYQIDLSTANADRFRAQLAPFINHVRNAGRDQPVRPGRSSAARRASAEVRALGQGPRHRDQRTRTHPSQRHQAVRDGNVIQRLTRTVLVLHPTIYRDVRCSSSGQQRRWARAREIGQ
jgi:Lsr2